uniref:No apical meristem-associated C-terminal domain-containing protein n=1 Tax=Lactuca sativa TaxID=4236 RepID=A0A9R1VX41_LACSA|nr:hypothetical protein LSAT_V11C400211270 [Lactuca sativa]
MARLTTQERVPRTKEEEEKLAEAWVSASQDPIERDNQTFNYVWEKVRSMFYALTGSERIYNNLQNISKSGSNNFDVFKAILDQFEKTTPTCKAFPYVKSWLKLKDALKWKEKIEETSQTSSSSKRSRNSDATSQQSNGRTHIDIKDDPLDLEDEQPLCRPVGRNKAKKAGLSTSGSSVIDHFREKFVRYAETLSQVEQKMIEVQTPFQEAQTTLQTKTNIEILKMKADDLEDEDLEIFLAMKDYVRAVSFLM